MPHLVASAIELLCKKAGIGIHACESHWSLEIVLKLGSGQLVCTYIHVVGTPRHGGNTATLPVPHASNHLLLLPLQLGSFASRCTSRFTCPSRPCFLGSHYTDSSRVVSVMADAEQSFPILASPVARLDDRIWLATLFLQDENVVESKRSSACFDDSLLRREPEFGRVRLLSVAALLRLIRTEMPRIGGFC